MKKNCYIVNLIYPYPAPNKGMHPTANSGAFMRKTPQTFLSHSLPHCRD